VEVYRERNSEGLYVLRLWHYNEVDTFMPLLPLLLRKILWVLAGKIAMGIVAQKQILSILSGNQILTV
jgi:hypothetical protein